MVLDAGTTIPIKVEHSGIQPPDRMRITSPGRPSRESHVQITIRASLDIATTRRGKSVVSRDQQRRRGLGEWTVRRGRSGITKVIVRGTIVVGREEEIVRRTLLDHGWSFDDGTVSIGIVLEQFCAASFELGAGCIGGSDVNTGVLAGRIQTI